MKKLFTSILSFLLATTSLSAQTIIDSVLYIAEGTTEIAHHAYYKNTNFTQVVIPSSVTRIANCAFYRSNLKSVTIPGSVKTIEHEAFRFCPLKEIIIEEGCEEIGSMACYSSEKDAVITLPESVKSMPTTGSYAGIAGATHTWIVVHGSYAQEYHNGRCPIVIDYSKPYSAYSGDKVLTTMIEQNIPVDYFKNCPNLQTVILGSNVSEILPGTFDEKVKLRVARGSFAERWALQNGYYLCEACADLSTYTKDATQKIDEDFERILCNSDTPFEIGKYHFNVAQPLTLDIVDGKLELTSYMLYPCENVTVKKIDFNGIETEIASFDKIQSLARYMILNEADPEATYTISADDEFYQSLNKNPMKWNISFTKVLKNGGGGDWLILKAPQCREWISFVTQLAYIFGSEQFAEMFLSPGNHYFTDAEDLNYLTTEQVTGIYEKLKKHSLQLGTLDDRTNGNVAGMGSVGGNLLGLDEPYLVRYHSVTNPYATFAHEIMHNMGYKHNSNLCGNNSNGVIFQNEFEELVKQFKTANTLPYSEESILATKMFWYDDYFYINKSLEEDENYEYQGAETSVTESVANVIIYAANRTIIIENATDEIRVYDVMGRLLCRDATPCVRAELRMNDVGVYVVKIGNFAKKIVVD